MPRVKFLGGPRDNQEIHLNGSVITEEVVLDGEVYRLFKQAGSTSFFVHQAMLEQYDEYIQGRTLSGFAYLIEEW